MTKHHDDNAGNVIEATERLWGEGPRDGAAERPPLTAAERRVLRAYVRARRQEARAGAKAEAMAGEVAGILRGRPPVRVAGAQLALEVARDYRYSRTVEILTRTLEEHRALERARGTAKAVLREVVSLLEG